MDILTVLTIVFFVILIVSVLVAAFFFDAPSADEQTAVAVARADELIAELEATDALIRRARLALADGLEGHAVATLTILGVAGQLRDAETNLGVGR